MTPNELDSDAKAAWRPIQLGDYRAPSHDAREGLREMLGRIRLPGSRSEDVELADPEPVPEDFVGHLVPSLDLDAAAEQLGEPLGRWLEPGPEATRSVVLVGPPGSAVSDVLERWARSVHVTRLVAPSDDELDDGAWEPTLPEDRNEPLVLPPLERLFLRRVGGLDALRRLLLRLQSDGRPYACAADSWAWSFLDRSLDARLGFDRVLAPAPLDGAGLGRWLLALGADVELHVTGSGRRLLDDEDGPHEYLRNVAARARGIPGIAATIWKQALCGSRIGGPAGDRQRCLLPAWKDVKSPKVGPRAGKDAALVLHALLVHGSLTERRLPDVVPLTASTARGLLWELHGVGIATCEGDRWSVSPAGYPATRSHLATFNVPLDGF